MTHSVLLLSRYERKGPSSRVRHYNYLPFLERAGFRVTTAPFLDEEYLDRFFRGQRRSGRNLVKAYLRRLRQIVSAQRYDLIWIEKEALPWMPAGLELRFFRNRPVVIDFDDAWYLRYGTHRIALVRAVLGKKLETVISHARVVTAGSAMLADWAKRNASVVIELPSAVDVTQYPILPLPDGPFTIAWIGTPLNEPYLALIAEPLRYLHRTYGARLRIIGGGRQVPLPGVAVERVPWSEDTEAREVASCHVGVMPMRDGAWERGKCGFKLVQYMAAARPAVASPVGAGPSIVIPGETGFLAHDVPEWTAALARLAADRELTRKLGLSARQRAENTYSLQVNAPKLVAALRNALEPTLP